MQVSESERLLLVQKKEEICKISQEILAITGKEQTNRHDVIEVKQKMIQILSNLHIIASYSSPNRDLDAIMRVYLQITAFQIQTGDQLLLPGLIEFFVTVSNSVEFSYSWFPTIFKAQVKGYGIEMHK